jgi:hypothetical protein
MTQRCTCPPCGPAKQAIHVGRREGGAVAVANKGQRWCNIRRTVLGIGMKEGAKGGQTAGVATPQPRLVFCPRWVQCFQNWVQAIHLMHSAIHGVAPCGPPCARDITPSFRQMGRLMLPPIVLKHLLPLPPNQLESAYASPWRGLAKQGIHTERTSLYTITMANKVHWCNAH